MEQPSKIDAFIERVQWLNEVEVGDFRRKLGLYISRLSQDLGAAPPKVQAKIMEMKNQVLFETTENIEEIRRMAIGRARELKALH